MAESATNKTNWSKGLHRIFYVLCAAWVLWWVVVVPFKMQASSMEFHSGMYDLAIKDCNSNVHDRPRDWEQVDACNQAALKQYLESNKGVQGIYMDAVTKATASDITDFFSLLIIPPLVLYGLIRFFVWLVVWIAKGFA